ncbi:MAG: arginine--tRNA ligase [Rickettsiales bacterium]|jgi:arginyl-tRNA synthetase|nr:arginine--tRNA ligase [Rickettsiales bacterium]
MIIKDKIVEILKENGITGLTLKKSSRLDLSDFASSDALRLASELRKKPIDIANELKEKLKKIDIFENVTVDGPGFLNFKMSDDFWKKCINELSQNSLYKEENTKKIVIDYGGPNIAKPLHAGHLRSAVIGEALKRILKKAGNEVIADIHLGDWGLQMGLVFVGIEDENIDINNISMSVLNDLYPKYSKLAKEDDEILKRAQRYTYLLQEGDVKFKAWWQKCYEVSVKAIKENYGKLDISFDLFLGESDSEEVLKKLAEGLKAKKLLRFDDGAYVLDIKEEMDKKEMPPLLIIKSNGSFGYHGTDIATIKQRMDEFAPEKIVYVTDFRQNLHFEQVFRAVRKIGIVGDDTDLVHVGYGTMNGKDGKPFKTRDGGVLRLEDFIALIVKAGYDKIKDEKVASSQEKEKLALNIGVAALKFGDLQNVVTSDYVLDLDAFASFEGKTGPYIQYSAVRIKSVLEKVGNIKGEINFYNEYDFALAKELLEFDDAFKESYEKLAPHYICLKAYEIAQKFNTFYHFCYIVDEQDEKKKASWVELCRKTLKVFEDFADLIGFELVDRM